MNDIIAIVNSFTTTNWIAIVGIVIGILLWVGTHYLNARRERKKTFETTPDVKATINRKNYPNGWRSVQLHVVPAPDQQHFKYENWHIEYASLLSPTSAVLARAQDDDYASDVFYPDAPVRYLPGKIEGLPQRFALEFFIKFKGDDHGQKAKFKVSFAHVTKRRRHSTKVSAIVPHNAE